VVAVQDVGIEEVNAGRPGHGSRNRSDEHLREHSGAAKRHEHAIVQHLKSNSRTRLSEKMKRDRRPPRYSTSTIRGGRLTTRFLQRRSMELSGSSA
jgi:hypothetical protein